MVELGKCSPVLEKYLYPTVTNVMCITCQLCQYFLKFSNLIIWKSKNFLSLILSLLFLSVSIIVFFFLNHYMCVSFSKFSQFGLIYFEAILLILFLSISLAVNLYIWQYQYCYTSILGFCSFSFVSCSVGFLSIYIKVISPIFWL